MDKATFLATLQAERARWDALLAQMDEGRMTQPGAAGPMSVKDIIAHIAWYEREMVGMLRQRALVGSDLWNLPTDPRNAAILETSRLRPLDEVRAESERIYAELVEAVQALSDNDLNDPAPFRDMPADWIPWQIIADNSYAHYPDHIPDVQAWLATQQATPPVQASALVAYLDDYLRIGDYKDASDNGLQVQGADGVAHVAFAVDACLASFDGAAGAGAQLLIVHHGLFWGRVRRVTGPHYRQLKALLDGGVGLYACHLPLDAHPDVGNNAELCRLLGLTHLRPFAFENGKALGIGGDLPQPLPREALAQQVAAHLGAESHLLAFGPETVQRVAICSGGASVFIPDAAREGYDLFLTGETKHSAYHEAEEHGLNVLYGGHYATETVGLKALARHLADRFGVQTTFLDLPTGL